MVEVAASELQRTPSRNGPKRLRGECSLTLRAAKVGLFGLFHPSYSSTFAVGALLVLFVAHLSESGYRSLETADHPGQSHNNDDKPHKQAQKPTRTPPVRR
jgi:hypothetical protein